MADPLRILLVADSHLGFDLPANPRVSRRRRGHDFLANHAAALAPALAGEVDLVVHGGDVFHRPNVPATLAWQGLDPLVKVAERGVPVFIVPGNHERARIPHARFAQHPRVHVFDRPRTFVVEARGRRVALAGFPYERRNVRARFLELLGATGWPDVPADTRLLCVHHCVEGATVGPGDFTFTSAPDVIRGRDLPAGFAAVLSGHIHRAQVLTTHLSGRPLAAPVLYPGSIERTSTAEIGEPKGYMVVDVDNDSVRWTFRELPARPMRRERLSAGDPHAAELDAALRVLVAASPPDAVLHIRVEGDVRAPHRRVLSSAHLRSFVPESMNVEVRAGAIAYARTRRPPRPPEPNLHLEL